MTDYLKIEIRKEYDEALVYVDYGIPYEKLTKEQQSFNMHEVFSLYPVNFNECIEYIKKCLQEA